MLRLTATMQSNLIGYLCIVARLPYRGIKPLPPPEKPGVTGKPFALGPQHLCSFSDRGLLHTPRAAIHLCYIS